MIVAVFALHAERSRDELHRGNQLVRRNAFQHLNILELFFGEFSGRIDSCRPSRRPPAGVATGFALRAASCLCLLRNHA